jgi:hypothetical protein
MAPRVSISPHKKPASAPTSASKSPRIVFHHRGAETRREVPSTDLRVPGKITQFIILRPASVILSAAKDLLFLSPQNHETLLKENSPFRPTP